MTEETGNLSSCGAGMDDTYFTERRTGRNHFGVKNSSDLYRTFKGEHYPSWETDSSPEYVAALRAAGVRLRRLTIDGSVEMFIHHADVELARTVPGAR